MELQSCRKLTRRELLTLIENLPSNALNELDFPVRETAVDLAERVDELSVLPNSH